MVRSMSTFLYVALCQMFMYYTGLRQVLAISILLVMLETMKKRHWVLFFLGVYIATLFHSSAVVGYILPIFYFLKFKRKEIVVTLAAVGVTLFASQNVFLYALTFFEKYEKGYTSSSVFSRGYINQYSIMTGAIYIALFVIIYMTVAWKKELQKHDGRIFRFSFHKLHAEFCFKGLRFSTLKEVWVFTFFIFLNQIIDQINLNVDKFLLGRLTGTVSVALYGVGSQLNTLYMQLSSSVSNVFVPRVNTIVANHEGNDKLSYIFIKVGRIQFMIMALVLSGFVFYGKYFISIWAGKGYDQSYWVALFLMLPVTVPLIQNIGIEIQRAKNMHQIRSVVYFLIAVCNVGISIPLIKLYGPVGATIGTAIALLLGNIIFMNWFYYKKIELDILLFWKNIFTLTLSMIPAFIVGILTSTVLKCTSITRLLIYIVIYSIVYGLSVYRFGMNLEEKQLIDKPIKKLVHRK